MSKDILSGFSAVFEGIGVNSIDPDKLKNVVSNDDDVIVDEVGNIKEPEKIDKLPADDDDVDVDVDVDVDDESNEDDDNKADDVDDEKLNSDDDNTVSLFFDAIAESAGWGNIDDESKPKTIEEMISYFNDVIEENSTPRYSSKEVEELDEFVKNGGKISDFMSNLYYTDYDSMDISNEFVQKKVIQELLEKKGFSDAQITRKLEKYEDAEILEDEAKDAIEHLKELAEIDKKALLEEQKKSNELAKQEQQRFVSSVISEIEALDEIRGIKIPKEDKAALKSYLLDIESDGKTRYMKDYAKSTKNLIESAYFTWKGDSLIGSAKKSGETSAVDKFKSAMKNTKFGNSKQHLASGPSRPLWTLASKSLLA